MAKYKFKTTDESRPKSDRIDYDEIDKSLAASIQSRLGEWFADKPVKLSGQWYKIGNQGSLSVNQYDGHWHSFEDDQSGKGMLSLYAYRYNVSLEQAAEDLQSNVVPFRTARQEPAKKPKVEQWEHAAIPPTDCPDSHFDNGKADHVYRYRGRDGSAIGVIMRWDATEDKGKDIRPLSWVQFHNKQDPEWKWCAFAEPRPLYRGERIDREGGKPILIVEGEKCVEAAEKHLPDWIVISWPGGSSAVNKCDWSGFEGRRVAIWPDNDEAGIKAAESIKRHIQHAEIIDVAGFGEKEDLADIIEAGEIERAIEMLPSDDSIFVNLDDILSGELEPELPTVAPSISGECLLYAGRINEIHGEPSVGKTNITLSIIGTELLMGRDVVFIDPEDNPQGIVKRAVAFGIPKESIRRHLKYVHDPAPEDVKAVMAWADRNKPSVVSIDGLAEMISLCGFKEDDAVSILGFFREYVRPFTSCGAAVLLSDHVVKSTEGRGTWSRGSGAKMGRYDGVSYMVTLAKPYSPKQAGAVKFTIAKDRNGGIGTKGEEVFMAYIEPKNGVTDVQIRRLRKEDTMPMDEIKQIVEMVKEWQRHGEYPNKGTIYAHDYGSKMNEKRIREMLKMAIECEYLEYIRLDGERWDRVKVGSKSPE